MPLGVPTQQRPAGKSAPPRPMPGGSGGSQTAPTPKTQTTTVLPPNDPNQVPLSVNNPGPAQFFPPGTTSPSRAGTLPGQVVISDIPKGVVPDGKGGVVGNYGLDTSTYDALQAAQAAQWARSNSLNAGLGFDMALAQRGNEYDRNLLGLNHMSDMARLGNSRYRDVDLARLGLRNAGDAAARMYNINSQRLGDQFGFGQRAYNINSQRLGDQLGFGQRAYNINLQQLADQLGFGQRAFNLGMQSSDYGAGMQRRTLTDQTAAAGSASATGTAQGFTDIDRNLGFTQRGIRDTWDQVQANNVTGRQSADLDWARTQADVNSGRQSADLDWARTQADVNSGRRALDSDWATTQADLARQNKVIDSIAKDYGVTSGQMKQAFKLGMDRLGLDYATVTDKFTAAMVSNNAQAQAAADALLLQVLAAAQGG